MEDKKKKLGQVFTPEWVVELILDKVEYTGKKILDQYILEPGCGTGNFLYSIVERYICSAKKNKLTKKQIQRNLEKYIYGIEVDSAALKVCKERLDTLVKKYAVPKVRWNIQNEDILDIKWDTLPRFDFVVGNPPYVRVHNLDKKRLAEIKSNFHFCKNGIIDLFLVFFEIGIRSLNNNGRLGFITPNSFIHNSTYVDFRKYLTDNGLVKEVINFKESVIFDEVSTYNAITFLDKKHQCSTVDYYEYICENITYINSIDLQAQNLKKWNFTDRNGADFLTAIQKSQKKISDVATVQYGFATLFDKAYLVKDDGLFSFADKEREVVYPVVKASRFNGEKNRNKIIYPYYFHGDTWLPIPEEIFKKKYPETYEYLLRNKNSLKKRSSDKGIRFWYEYGRSQGVQTIHNEKLVISPIIKNEVKVFKVDKKTMVYSGIFLFLKENSQYTLDDFIKILQSEDFLKYVRIVGKDMRGGYKSINTKAIKDFSFSF